SRPAIEHHVLSKLALRGRINSRPAAKSAGNWHYPDPPAKRVSRDKVRRRGRSKALIAGQTRGRRSSVGSPAATPTSALRKRAPCAVSPGPRPLGVGASFFRLCGYSKTRTAFFGRDRDEAHLDGLPISRDAGFRIGRSIGGAAMNFV